MHLKKGLNFNQQKTDIRQNNLIFRFNLLINNRITA